MSVSDVGWAFDLRGISPLAKLVAIKISNEVGDDRTVKVRLRETLAWVNCDAQQLMAALGELRQFGISWEDYAGYALKIHFPADEPKIEPTHFEERHTTAIYVISNGSICKIGISQNPDSRLFNLQGSIPTLPLTKEFVKFGPPSVIRQVERACHARLAAKALGREWFDVSAGGCVTVVREELEQHGLLDEGA